MALKWIGDAFIAGYEDGSVIYWKEGEGELLHLFKQPVLCVDAVRQLVGFASAEGGLVLMNLNTLKVSNALRAIYCIGKKSISKVQLFLYHH